MCSVNNNSWFDMRSKQDIKVDEPFFTARFTVACDELNWDFSVVFFKVKLKLKFSMYAAFSIMSS